MHHFKPSLICVCCLVRLYSTQQSLFLILITAIFWQTTKATTLSECVCANDFVKNKNTSPVSLSRFKVSYNSIDRSIDWLVWSDYTLLVRVFQENFVVVVLFTTNRSKRVINFYFQSLLFLLDFFLFSSSLSLF